MISKILSKNMQFFSTISRIKFNKHLKTESIHDSYEIKELIGKGGFGSVYNGYMKQDKNKKVAIKRIDKHINDNKMSELDILNYLSNVKDNPDSKFIINFLDSFNNNEEVYIITDLYTGGDLYDKIVSLKQNKLSELSASIIMEQIFRGLLYLHQNNIVHRDIKPENIVFRNNNYDLDIVIIDLGMSSKMTDELHNKHKFVDDRIMLSSCYISPESLNGYYNTSSDIWSAGVIMYMLLLGEHPFYDKSISVTQSNIKKGNYNIYSKKWEKISDSSKNLLSEILEIDPDKRIDIVNVLQHPWFSKSNRML